MAVGSIVGGYRTRSNNHTAKIGCLIPLTSRASASTRVRRGKFTNFMRAEQRKMPKKRGVE